MKYFDVLNDPVNEENQRFLAFGDFPYGLHIMIQSVVVIDCT